MTREEKVAKARELRKQGLMSPAIARELGVTPSCVRKWLDPERAKEYARRQNARPERKAAKRAWEREHDHGICPRCGGSTGPVRQGAQRCRTCELDDRAAAADATYRRLEALWLAGKTFPEIEAALGWAKGTVSSAVHEARARGYNLPYRYPAVAVRHAASEAA